MLTFIVTDHYTTTIGHRCSCNEKITRNIKLPSSGNREVNQNTKTNPKYKDKAKNKSSAKNPRAF